MNCNHPMFEAWLSEQVKDKRIDLAAPDSNNICSLVSDAFITGQSVGVGDVIHDFTQVFELLQYQMKTVSETAEPFSDFVEFLIKNGFVPPVKSD